MWWVNGSCLGLWIGRLFSLGRLQCFHLNLTLPHSCFIKQRFQKDPALTLAGIPKWITNYFVSSVQQLVLYWKLLGVSLIALKWVLDLRAATNVYTLWKALMQGALVDGHQKIVWATWQTATQKVMCAFVAATLAQSKIISYFLQWLLQREGWETRSFWRVLH